MPTRAAPSPHAPRYFECWGEWGYNTGDPTHGTTFTDDNLCPAPGHDCLTIRAHVWVRYMLAAEKDPL